MKKREECIVFVYLPNQAEAVPAGVLTIHQSGREVSSTFVYGNQYRQRLDAISLDPQELPLTQKLSEVHRPLHGNVLFGCLRDAAPDAWGRLVINDRWARSHPVAGQVQAPNTFDLPEMEYLMGSRNDRVGALDFRASPTDPEPPKKISGVMHIEQLAVEASRIARHEPASAAVMTLLYPATGMGGARPKTSIEDDTGMWLAKFPLLDDRLPVTRIEHAMLVLAAKCGINSAESKLYDLGQGEPVFMVKRFDREVVEQTPDAARKYTRTQYVSALTALGKDEFNQSTSSYQDIANFVRRRQKADLQSQSRQDIFKRMVFNILVNNDDDHMRNHGFLRNSDGSYGPSPMFDVVPRMIAPGMGMERRQAIGVGKFGRDGTLENILSDLSPFDLTKEQARDILANMASVIAEEWQDVMQEAGVAEDIGVAFAPIMRMASDVLMEMTAAAVEQVGKRLGQSTDNLDSRDGAYEKCL